MRQVARAWPVDLQVNRRTQYGATGEIAEHAFEECEGDVPLSGAFIGPLNAEPEPPAEVAEAAAAADLARAIYEHADEGWRDAVTRLRAHEAGGGHAALSDREARQLEDAEADARRELDEAREHLTAARAKADRLDTVSGDQVHRDEGPAEQGVDAAPIQMNYSASW